MRVMIAEDQALLRDGLARLFTDDGHDSWRCSATPTASGSCRRAPAPDLVVLDIRMPPTFTDEGAPRPRSLKQRTHPARRPAALPAHRDHPRGRPGRLGGFGYLLKDRVLDVDDFLAAAERVARGGSALDPKVVGQPRRHHASAGPLASSPTASATCSR